MTLNSDNDFIRQYETALETLSRSPGDRRAQHMAVLALARMGSLDLACAAYRDYGLDRVRHDEDIMALGGRLSKDRFIRAKMAGDDRASLDYARESAALYEAAYKDSGGSYSGVNAATMALLAAMPLEIVVARADNILAQLPPAKDLTPTNHYFNEATRAECLLLRGDGSASESCLRAAIAFDPQNYAAHASTLKQFDLILGFMKSDKTWLSQLSPPHPLHFAGHIWSSDEGHIPDDDMLATLITDQIQRSDIGYGYGALAAGADIITAELLLEEGAELNVVLPGSADDFMAQSVAPFGADWTTRFHACLEAATSVMTLPILPQTPAADGQLLAGRVAMGQAVLRAQHFNVRPSQMLIWDRTRETSLTSHHAQNWQDDSRDQIIVPIALPPIKTTPPQSSAPLRPTPSDIGVIVARSDCEDRFRFDTLAAALTVVRGICADPVAKSGAVTVALHHDLADQDDVLDALLAHSLPDTVLVSESIASCLALLSREDTALYYVGLAGGSQRSRATRCYRFDFIA